MTSLHNSNKGHKPPDASQRAQYDSVMSNYLHSVKSSITDKPTTLTGHITTQSNMSQTYSSARHHTLVPVTTAFHWHPNYKKS